MQLIERLDSLQLKELLTTMQFDLKRDWACYVILNTFFKRDCLEVLKYQNDLNDWRKQKNVFVDKLNLLINEYCSQLRKKSFADKLLK